MQLSASAEALAHTVWVDCRQLAADSEQAEAAHQSAAGAARAELETQARIPLAGHARAPCSPLPCRVHVCVLTRASLEAGSSSNPLTLTLPVTQPILDPAATPTRTLCI